MENNEKDQPEGVFLEDRLRQLGDPDPGVRTLSTGLLATHYIEKRQWKEMAELLRNRDETVRAAAISMLWSFFSKETKIEPPPSFLGDALFKALQEPKPANQISASIACTYYCLHTRDTNGIKKLLFHKEEDVRNNAANALVVAMRMFDVSAAVPTLQSTMRRIWLVSGIVSVCRFFSGAKLPLELSAVDRQMVQTIAYHYLRTGAYRKFEKLLKTRVADVQKNVLRGLMLFTYDGGDPTKFIAHVQSKAWYRDFREESLRVLAVHYMRTGDWEGMISILVEENFYIRERFVPVLAMVISKTEPVDELERFQERLEAFFLDEIRKQPQRADAEEMRKRINRREEFVKILRAIGERKAELAKERDGELLAGETIPIPAGNRMNGGIYRIEQRIRLWAGR